MSRPRKERPKLTPAQQKLVESEVKMVRRILRRLKVQKTSVDHDHLEDVRSTGHEALAHSSQRFDPQKGRFGSFAWKHVYGEMVEQLHRPQSVAQEVTIAAMKAGIDIGAMMHPNIPVMTPNTQDMDGCIAEMCDEVATGIAANFYDLLSCMGEEGWILIEESRRFMEAFSRACEALPSRERKVFELRWKQRLPIDEIVQELHVSRATVERRLTSALERLGKALAREGFTQMPQLVEDLAASLHDFGGCT